jgi:hypothetical protein
VGISYAQVYADPNPITRTHNYTMQVQIKFTRAGDNTGFVNVWRDGVQIVNSAGQIGFGFNTYWKCGLYRGAAADTQIAQYQNLIATPGPLALSTASTYVVQAGDIGVAIDASVVASNAYGSSVPAVAVVTGTVTAASGGGTPAARISSFMNTLGTATIGLFTVSPSGIVADMQYLGLSIWRGGMGGGPVQSAVGAAGLKPRGGKRRLDLPIAPRLFRSPSRWPQ